jgi:dTDP-glucose pyrophosphorylase/CBS domain-containing protein
MGKIMDSWKDIAVPNDGTIGDAVRMIDASPHQVAVVVDGNGALAGLLTDGDVRRALLRGLGLDARVTAAMNPSPVSAPVASERAAQIAEMRRLGIKHLPLVDDERRLVGLATLDELTGRNRHDNWVVLMAGGLGSRLAPLTDTCPKPMLRVGDKPLLQTILEKFIDDGFHRFFLSVHHLAEMVEDHFGDGSDWGVDIQYLRETKQLGTGGALGLLSQAPNLPLVVMNGDLLTKVNFQQLLDFHRKTRSTATMCVRTYEHQVPYGVVTTDQHRLLGIVEKPVHSFFVNAGIYVVEPAALELVPSDEFFDMPSLFTKLIEAGHETAAFPIREYWLDIGHMADFQRANGEYGEHFS